MAYAIVHDTAAGKTGVFMILATVRVTGIEIVPASIERARKVLARRLMTCKSVFDSTATVRDFLMFELAEEGREVFYTIFLNSQNGVIAFEPLFVGTLEKTSVHPREVVRRSLELGAAAVILAHNHPSGTVIAKLDRVLGLVKPGDFLIADECGIPAEKGTGLRFFGYIHERARIPVAMIGNPSFHAAVWGKRNDYDALASRTRHTSLEGSSAGDVEAFMDWRKLVARRSAVAALCKPARGQSSSGWIRLPISSAKPDSAVTFRGAAVDIPVLANDTDQIGRAHV